MCDKPPRLFDRDRVAIRHRLSSKKRRITTKDAKVSQRTRWALSLRVLCASFASPAVKRFLYRSSGTIQNGFEPRATRSQLSNALRQRFGWLSQVGPAECGLKIAFFSVNSS